MSGKSEDQSGFSRRDLFRGGRLRNRLADAAKREAAASKTRAHPASFPVMRPPGAVAEESFLLKCTRCADCITACPHDAIVIAPPRMRAAAGTPTIVTAQSPCRMCSDTPCITACDTGALVAENGMQMGSALIVQQSCLAYQKNFCSVCSEQCPVPGAIRLVEGKPLIDDQVCTGCGVCEFVCPAQQNAILIRPKRIG